MFFEKKANLELELHSIFIKMIWQKDIECATNSIVEIKGEKDLFKLAKNRIIGTEKEEKKLEQKKTELEKFNQEMLLNKFDDDSEQRISYLVDKIFANDDNYERRIAFIVSLILAIPNDIESSSKNDIYLSISKMLGFNVDMLSFVEKEFENTFYELKSNQEFNKEKALAIGIPVGCLCLLAGLPFVLASTTIASSLATLGLVSISSIGAGALTSYVVYCTKEGLDEEKLKEAIKELNPTEFAYGLTQVLVQIKALKLLNLSASEMLKNHLKKYLKISSYVNEQLFVDDFNNDSISKKKMINSADKILIKMMAI